MYETIVTVLAFLPSLCMIEPQTVNSEFYRIYEPSIVIYETPIDSVPVFFTNVTVVHL